MRPPMVCALCLGFAVLGCGGPANVPPTPDELKQTALSDVGELYRLYIVDHKKPPQKVADFNAMEMMSPTGLRALKSGDVIAYMNVELPDLGEETGKGAGDVVLAYEKKTPQEGGQVLMLNRTIKTLTSQEFQSAKKASTDSSAPSGGTPAKTEPTKAEKAGSS